MTDFAPLREEQIETTASGGLENPVEFLNIQDSDAGSAPPTIESTLNPRVLLDTLLTLNEGQYGGRIHFFADANNQMGFIGAIATADYTGTLSISNTAMLEFWSGRGNAETKIFEIGRDPNSLETSTTEDHLKVVAPAYFQSDPVYIGHLEITDVDDPGAPPTIENSAAPKLVLRSAPVLLDNQYGGRIQIFGNGNTQLGFFGAKATRDHVAGSNLSNHVMLQLWSARGTSETLIMEMGRDENSLETSTTEDHLKVIAPAYFQNDTVYIADLEINDPDAPSAAPNIVSTLNPKLTLRTTPVLSQNDYGGRIRFLGDGNTQFGSIGIRAANDHVPGSNLSNDSMIEIWDGAGNSEIRCLSMGRDPNGLDSNSHLRCDVPAYFQDDVTFDSGVNFDGLPLVAAKRDTNSLSGRTTVSQTFPNFLNFGNQAKPAGTHDVYCVAEIILGERLNEGDLVKFIVEIDGTIVSTYHLSSSEANDYDVITLRGYKVGVTGTTMSVRIGCESTGSTTLLVNPNAPLGDVSRLLTQFYRNGEL